MEEYLEELEAKPPTHAIGGGSITDNPNRFMYYPSHPVEGSAGGVILASYTWADDARRWDSMDDAARFKFALRGLRIIHGWRIELFYSCGATQSWARSPYAFGEAAVFNAGQLSTLHPHIPTPEGPVHFAGEHTLAPPISLDSRLAKTAGPERKGRDGPEAEGEQGDRRS